jgi:hypothetical protein
VHRRLWIERVVSFRKALEHRLDYLDDPFGIIGAKPSGVEQRFRGVDERAEQASMLGRLVTDRRLPQLLLERGLKQAVNRVPRQIRYVRAGVTTGGRELVRDVSEPTSECPLGIRAPVDHIRCFGE